tara:strand:+ start:3668 stop:4804 length:1137 start_codon:yes stop_codon:yes gene_type:complete
MLAAFRENSESNLAGASEHPPTRLASAAALKCFILAVVSGSAVNLTAEEDIAAKSPPAVSESQKPTRTTALPVLPQHLLSGRPLLDWGSRFPISPPKIQLIGATQESPSSAALDSPIDETRLLLQQLGELESLSTVEPPAGESSDIRNLDTVQPTDTNQTPTSSAPPLMIPRLIDRPDEIDDQNVGPIPTRPAKAITTTIPVIPETDAELLPPGISRKTTDSKPSDAVQAEGTPPSIYEATPRLLTQSDAPAAASSEQQTGLASVWELAAAQLVSTFLGVMLAVGLFLLIRAAAGKFFGTQLGVTFQFGSAKKASTLSKTDDESAHVVPFGSQNSLDVSGNTGEPSQEPGRVAGVSSQEPGKPQSEESPASVPLRRAA